MTFCWAPQESNYIQTQVSASVLVTGRVIFPLFMINYDYISVQLGGKFSRDVQRDPCRQVPELSPAGRWLQELPRLLQRGHWEADQCVLLFRAVHRQGAASSQHRHLLRLHPAGEYSIKDCLKYFFPKVLSLKWNKYCNFFPVLRSQCTHRAVRG